ncbi:MAG: hypothetical protein IJB79_00470 [Candidatus Gastranaerophilales bacterium]|nr:hypothetical protein [Candidatus Gastranaerophilales bacterium]
MAEIIPVSSLSQANQAYIQRLNSQTTTTSIDDKQLKKDEFKSRFKKGLKIGTLIYFGGLAASVAYTCVKNPAKVKKIIQEAKESKIIRNNRKVFNEEKVFSEAVDFRKLFDEAVQKLKDVKLNLDFDEKTITDADLMTRLADFDVYKSDVDAVRHTLRNDPDSLHLFNILSGLKAKGANVSYYDFKKFAGTNYSKDELETYFKMIEKYRATSETTYLGIESQIKEIVAMTELRNKTLRNCGILTHHSDRPVTLYKNFTADDVAEVEKYFSTLKKGTVLNDVFDFGHKMSYFDNYDYRKARKFYDSLKPDVLKKIKFSDIRNLTNIKGMNSVEVSKILNETPSEVLQGIDNSCLDVYVQFRDFYGVKNINELNIAQKKDLLRRLVSSNVGVFASGKDIAPVLPNNQEEYCKLMDKLAKSIGVDTKPLSKIQHTTFTKGLDDVAKSIKGVDLSKISFELNYPRHSFVQDVQAKLDKLSENQKAQVMDYFGFEIKDGILKGYPINVNNGDKLKEIESPQVKKIIEEVRPLVQKFSSSANTVTIKGGSKEFSASVNELLEGIPELRTMFQKAQHETHAFTLDVHTFKVLQEVCSNPKFEKLSSEDKKVLEIASLLHDITKVEGLRDPAHPIESAFDAFYIIQKLNLPESQQLKIYELVKTHNWLQQLNDPKSKELVENIAQDIAFDSRHSNTFELAKILCEADLKSVKKSDSFFNAHKKTLEAMSAKVDGYVNKLHQTQIVLPQTTIPKASEVVGGVQKSLGGINNTVVYMDDLDDDLTKYGFASGTTKANWTALVHALEEPEQMSKFDTFSVIDNEALLSTSFINPQEYRVFRKQGLILDVNSNDIHAGYERDFGTGYGKSIELLKQDYLFRGQRKDVFDDKTAWRRDRTLFREFIPEKIQKATGMTPEQYYQKLIEIQDCKSLTDVEKIDKDFADKLLGVFNDMHNGKRGFGRNYNEILVSRPKVQGVFAYDKSYADIPEFLRKYAQDNDMPIIIFGAKK